MISTFTTYSEKETIDLGIDLAGQLKHGDVVALFGDLGSGKTRFVQGICKGLGVREHTASPTFTIVNEYAVNAINIYHFDFYRINSLQEIREIGFDEYVNSDGICLIEWAEKASQLLPAQRYDVRFQLGKNEHIRQISIEHNVEVTA